MSKKNFAIVDGENIRKSCEQQLGRAWDIDAICKKVRTQSTVPDPIEVIVNVKDLSNKEIEDLHVNDCLIIHAPAFENGNGELKSIADVMLLGRINSRLNHSRSNPGRLLLLSGDKDLVEGVHAWHRQGGEVYILGIPCCVSHILIKTADKFISLVETEEIIHTSDNRKNVNSKSVAEAQDSRLEQAFAKLAQVLDEIHNDGYRSIPLNKLKPLLTKALDHSFDESRFGFSQFQDFIEAAEAKGLGKLYHEGTTAYMLIE